MPKSKYKYYRGVISGNIYKVYREVVMVYDEDRWIDSIFKVDTLKNPARFTQITEYQALHVDMFGDDL